MTKKKITPSSRPFFPGSASLPSPHVPWGGDRAGAVLSVSQLLPAALPSSRLCPVLYLLHGAPGVWGDTLLQHLQQLLPQPLLTDPPELPPPPTPSIGAGIPNFTRYLNQQWPFLFMTEVIAF